MNNGKITLVSCKIFPTKPIHWETCGGNNLRFKALSYTNEIAIQ